jgi:hypothetical protein
LGKYHFRTTVSSRNLINLNFKHMVDLGKGCVYKNQKT